MAPVSQELEPPTNPGRFTKDIFESLIGAKVVEIGAPDDESLRIEGGGLVIDYIASGSGDVRRLVLGFNENGMWIEFDGLRSMESNPSLPQPPSSS